MWQLRHLVECDSIPFQDNSEKWSSWEGYIVLSEERVAVMWGLSNVRHFEMKWISYQPFHLFRRKLHIINHLNNVSKVASFDVVVANQDRRSGDFNLLFVCSLFILLWVMIVSPRNNTKQSIIPSLVPPPPYATYSPLSTFTPRPNTDQHNIITKQIICNVLV